MERTSATGLLVDLMEMIDDAIAKDEAADEAPSFEAAFVKVDDDQHLVWAWAYVWEDEGQQVIDHSGDVIDAEALGDFEKAAYDYVLDSREADEMHVKVTDVAKLVESFFLTPEKAQLFGLVTKRYGWIVGYKVTDEAVWAKIKDGTYTGMSIRGSGDREAILAAA